MADLITDMMNSAGRIPLLTHEEEILLGRRIQAMEQLLVDKASGPYSKTEQRVLTRGRAARDRMITANIRLVANVCRKYQRNIPGLSLDLADLMQDGILGLVRAAQKFDPERGYKFSTYAYWWIKQGVNRGIQQTSRTIRLPLHLSEKHYQLDRIRGRLLDTLGRMPTADEMAAEVGISLQDYEKLLFVGAKTRSLDELAREDGSPLLDLLGNDEDAAMQLDELSDTLDKERLRSALTHLTDNEALIIRLRYGLDDDINHTYEEIGNVIGVSRERIRQLIKRSFCKLRRHLAQTQQVERPLYRVWRLEAAA